MNKLWTDDGWADYLYWQSQDKRIFKRINELIKDIEKNDGRKININEINEKNWVSVNPKTFGKILLKAFNIRKFIKILNLSFLKILKFIISKIP